MVLKPAAKHVMARLGHNRSPPVICGSHILPRHVYCRNSLKPTNAVVNVFKMESE